MSELMSFLGHLKNLLKPIPLETPTLLELAPGKTIRVTLFDANHCTGAVMFLIEGDGKAVIYTGDIRSEAWWVDTLCRHPLLIPYVSSGSRAPMKQLDCIYLDTTFAHKDDPYKHFPSKAEGLSELLLAASKYPKGTSFYFDSWTFGYEDVWQALSAALHSQIHVDDYRYGLYRALANGVEPKAMEASKLMGFQCGNHFQAGCLTTRDARIHSCEKGTQCDIWKKGMQYSYLRIGNALTSVPDFVRITPIITRHNGAEMAELGAGGGQGDLDQHHELEVWDPSLVGQLIALCAAELQEHPEEQASVMQMLTKLIHDRVQSIPLDHTAFDDTALDEGDEDFVNVDDLPLDRLVPALSKLVRETKRGTESGRSPSAKRTSSRPAARADGLPRQIARIIPHDCSCQADCQQTFPYSRHSSYSELCYLLEAFKPRDIHPCTVDKANWNATHSMEFLFGHIYGSAVPRFTHDQNMLRVRGPGVSFLPRPFRPSASSGDMVDEVEAGETPQTGRKHEGKWEDDWSRKRNRVRSPPRATTQAGHHGEGLASNGLFEATAVPAAPTSTTLGPPSSSLIEAGGVRPDLPNPQRLAQTTARPSLQNGHIPSSSVGQGGRASATAWADTASTVRRLWGQQSESPPRSSARLHRQRQAYEAALSGGVGWSEIGLVSTGGGHQEREEEL